MHTVPLILRKLYIKQIRHNKPESLYMKQCNVPKISTVRFSTAGAYHKSSVCGLSPLRWREKNDGILGVLFKSV
jgi:hypothetical protein